MALDDTQTHRVIERVLHVRTTNGIELSPMRMTLPYFVAEKGCWQCEVECEIFLVPSRIVCGEDAFQAMLLAFKHIKLLTMNAIERGINMYWLDEGDDCNWYGIDGSLGGPKMDRPI